MRALLSLPSVYLGFQALVGGTKMRSLCLALLEPQPGQRIVDIGCGPAYYLADLPAVDYHGFDTDARYIDHARKRFGSRGRFYVEPFTQMHADTLGPFDRVLLMGTSSPSERLRMRSAARPAFPMPAPRWTCRHARHGAARSPGLDGALASAKRQRHVRQEPIGI